MLFRSHRIAICTLIVLGVVFIGIDVTSGQNELEPSNAEEIASDQGESAGDVTAEPEPASSPEKPDASRPSLHIQLLMVRTDWSQGKDVDKTDVELKALLDGTTVPNSLRNDLLRAIPAMLFPQERLAAYDPAEFAEALAWMKQHELVRVHEFERLPVEETQPSVGKACHRQRLFVEELLMPLPISPRGDVPNDQRRNRGWEWYFQSEEIGADDGTGTFDIQVWRRPLRRLTDDSAWRNFADFYNPAVFRFSFRSDRIAVMNSTCVPPTANNQWWMNPPGLGPEGWMPVVAIIPGHLEIHEVDKPRLATPSSLIEITEVDGTDASSLVAAVRAASPDDSGAAQTTTESPAEEPGDRNAGRVNVQLIRVRSEWSQGKDPEGTKKILEVLLKDSPLPDHYREALLFNAPRILFPEGFVACYRAEQFADSLAWMESRDLARIDGRAEPSDQREYRHGTQKSVIHQTTLYVGEDVVPIEPTLVQEATPPFVKRTLGWEWTVESRLGTGTDAEEPTIELSIMRSMMQKDELQVDAEKPTVTTDSLSGRLSGARIPADKVAVIRCFDENDWAYGMSMSGPFLNQDWVPLLVVTPITLGEQEASDDPHLAKPASMIKQTSWRPSWTPEMYSRTSPIVMRSRPPSPEQAKADKQVVVFRLKHADPNQVIQALTAVAPNAAALTDDRLKSVIVTASKDDLAAVENLLKELDQPGAPQSPDAVPTRPEEKQLKIFQLQHSRAGQVAAILQQLFPEIVLTEDNRTNSLIALGDRRPMEIAEALLQRLDETPSEKREPPLDEASRRRILETASSEFASAEAEIQSIVESIAGEADKKKAEQLRARLAGLVAEAFDLRQKLQGAELALLKERVGIIESRLGQRETLRKEIIQQRVAELLTGETAPAEQTRVAIEAAAFDASQDKMVQIHFRFTPMGDVLQWLAEARGIELRILDKLPEEWTFNYHSVEPVTPNEAQEILQSVLLTKGYRLFETETDGKRVLCLQATPTPPTPVTIASPQAQPVYQAGQVSDRVRPALPLRSPEEFHRAARDARAAIADVKGGFDGLHGLQKQISESQYKEELARLEDNLASAEQQLALVQAEFAAQLQLLTLDVRTSEAQLAAAREALQRLTKLYEQKAVSESELSEARLKQEQALAQLEQAKTLLDLYQKAGQNPDLRPGSAKPTKDATDSQPTSTESASPVPPVTRGASPGSTSRLPLRSPEEFQQLAAEARAKAEKLDNDLSWAPGRKDAMDPAIYERYVSDLTAGLASAKQRLALVQAEYAAQIEMLTTELASAEAIVRSTEESLSFATEAFNSGMTPRAEVNNAEREYNQAKSQHDRAATLLKLYKRLETNPDLVPSTKEEPKAGKPAPTLPAPGNAGTTLPRDWATRLFKETRHDFGDISGKARLDHRFTVENTYLEDVHIAQVTPSPGISAHVTKSLLKTHEAAEIVVEVDPKDPKVHGTASSRVMVEFDKPFPSQVQLDVRLSEKPAAKTPE